MEIKNTTNNFFDPYAAGLDKSAEARNDTRLKARADGTGTEASQGDKVTVSQDALLLTEARRAAQSAPDVRPKRWRRCAFRFLTEPTSRTASLLPPTLCAKSRACSRRSMGQGALENIF